MLYKTFLPIFLIGTISAAIWGFSGEQSAGDHLTITAYAMAEGEPDVVTPDPKNSRKPHIQNGDFLITANAVDQSVGDGCDEFTIWNFDFKKDGVYQDFMKSKKKIKSARLIVVMKKLATIDTHQAFYIQDTVKGWDEVAKMRPHGYENVPRKEFSVLSFDLMKDVDSKYTSENFINAIKRKAPGCYDDTAATICYIFSLLSDTKEGDIPMIFRDDAIILFACLELIK